MANLKKLHDNMDKAAMAISKELEDRAIAATIKLSNRYPNREIMFCSTSCSASGSYTWSDEKGNEYFPPVYKAFEYSYSLWKYAAIPAPVYVKCKAGKVIQSHFY